MARAESFLRCESTETGTFLWSGGERSVAEPGRGGSSFSTPVALSAKSHATGEPGRDMTCAGTCMHEGRKRAGTDPGRGQSDRPHEKHAFWLDSISHMIMIVMLPK